MAHKVNYDRTFAWTINLMGLDIDVEVEWRVVTHGSPGGGPSMYGPGEPDEPVEIELGRITAMDTGYDLTDACNRPNGCTVYAARKSVTKGNRMLTAVMGEVLNPKGLFNRAPELCHYPTTLVVADSTLADEIEAAILESGEPDEYDDPSEYDRDCW